MSSEPEGHIKTADMPTPVQLVGVDESLRDSIKAPQQISIPPTTTHEQQLVTAGQRRVNIIWEITQAIIAIFITTAVIYAELNGKSSTILGNAFTLIVAIYFVRMNHIKIGGVGSGQEGR